MKTITSIKDIKRLARNVEAKFLRLPEHGAYKDADGNWHSYIHDADKVYVVPTPKGQLAVDFARYMAKNKATITVQVEGTSCECSKCSGTGKAFGGKCYQCDGKGWMSPIDAARFANFQKKQAAGKRKATTQRRKARAAS